MALPMTHLATEDHASCLKTIRNFDGNSNMLNSFLASVYRASSHCQHYNDQTTSFFSVFAKIVYPARDKLEPYDVEINNLKELTDVLICLFCPTRSYYDLQNKLSQAKQLHSKDIKSYANRLQQFGHSVTEAAKSDKIALKGDVSGHVELVTRQRFIYVSITPTFLHSWNTRIMDYH